MPKPTSPQGTIAVSAVPELPHLEIAELIHAASCGEQDAGRKARLLAQKLPRDISKQFLAEIGRRMNSAYARALTETA